MNTIFFKVGVCFLLSGLAALLYQTAWMRQISVVLGTSELAVAMVLTAYMGGLSLGSLIASKYINRVKRPLLTYGVLEGGIAISALLVPNILHLISAVGIHFLGNNPTPPSSYGLGYLIFYLGSSFLALLIPTALMGATLPLLSKYVVENDKQIGSRIGGLYAINTVGAVAGTLIAGFLLLPNIGLLSTVAIGVCINFVVLIICLNVVKRHNIENTSISNLNTRPLKSSLNTGFHWILPVMTLSGAATFIYEVLWTRLLSHLLGGSIPAFSIMLAGFLTGIAAGSAVASRFAENKQSSATFFFFTQITIALLSIATFYWLDAYNAESGGLFSNSLFAFACLAPSTFFIGATFPFAVRILSVNESDAASSSGRVYAWNTLGAILGATLAGYYLIPEIKYEGAIAFAVCLNLLLAITVAYLIKPIELASLVKASSVMLFICIALFFRPQWPSNILTTSAFQKVKQEDIGELVFYDVGRSSTVLVTKQNNAFYIRNNGLPESSIRSKGSPFFLTSQHMLSVLPVIARPQAQSMMIAGLGGGVALEEIPPSIELIDVLELEPKVIEANKVIADERQINPFLDERINFIENDARSALQLTSRKYDIIVSQPSHPWTAGASHLYTKEYMELAKSRLNTNGVYLQWMNTEFTDEYLLKALTSTLLDTFKYVRVYHVAPSVLSFLASDSPLDVEAQIIETGLPFSRNPDYYFKKGINEVEQLISSIAFDTSSARRFSEGIKPITDDYNILGTRSSFTIEQKGSLDYERLIDIITSHSPIFDPNSRLYKEDLAEQIDFNKVSKFLERLRSKNLNIRLYGALASASNPYTHVLDANIAVLNRNFSAAAEYYTNAIKAMPDNRNIRYEVARLMQLEGEFSRHIKESGTDFDKSKLEPSAISVLNHIKSASPDQSIGGILQAEEHLARSRRSDSWFSNSMKLRARWRIDESEKKGNSKLAEQALSLLDTLLVNFQDQATHEFRVQAATLALDEAAAYSSLFVLTYTLQLGVTQPNTLQALEGLNRRAKRLLKIIEASKFDSGESKHSARIVELKAIIQDLSGRIDTHLVKLKSEKS